MKKIDNSLSNFYNKHPYLTILLVGIIGSMVGIFIEYIVNSDFIAPAIYSVIFFDLLWMLVVKIKRSKNKKSDPNYNEKEADPKVSSISGKLSIIVHSISELFIVWWIIFCTVSRYTWFPTQTLDNASNASKEKTACL